MLLPVFLLAGCGSGGNGEDVGELLDTAFSNSITSADIKLEAQLDVRGSKSLKDPVRIEASGPFRSSDGKLPETDLTLKLDTDAGQVIETGFLSTGDRAFVKFQDVYYEESPAQVRRTNQELAKRAGKKRSSLAALGLDPRSWLAEAKDEGEERVAGVQTRHISGTLEVTQVLADLNRFVRRSSSALSGSGGAATKPLTAKEISDVATVVRDPTFDVYVGVDDDMIRRISGRIEVSVPEDQRAAVGGIEGGTLQFSIEFRDVNGDQTIEAPSRARPLKELTRSLGGAGALGDVVGGAIGGEVDDGDTDTTTEESTVPTTPTTPATPTPALPNGSSSGDDEPDAGDFKAYAECLDKARPEDTEALQRCAELLQG